MTKEQKLQAIREAVIMSCHPEAKSLDEALHAELKEGCEVIDKLHQFFGKAAPETMTLVYGDAIEYAEDGLNFLHYRGNPLVTNTVKEILDKEKFEILGLPITLARVLNWLTKVKCIKIEALMDGNVDLYKLMNMWGGEKIQYRKFCQWKLLNKDGTECTLENQSEECIDKLYSLI